MAMLLKGGPAFSVAQFENYKPITSLGVSFTMTAPTELYRPNKILNLGSDRWSFKPEIELSHPFGPEQKWEFDAYANAYFYAEPLIMERRSCGNSHCSALTDTLAIPSTTTSGSLLIRVTPFVVLLSSTASIKTIRNRISSWAGRVNVSVNSRNSLPFEFAKALVHQNGPAL
jgi:hypothetical protein